MMHEPPKAFSPTSAGPASAGPTSAGSHRGTDAGAAGPPAPASATSPLRAVEDVLALRGEQIHKFGHTSEKDAALPVDHLPREAKAALAAALDDIQFHRGGIAWDETRPRVRRRLVKAAAMLLAAIDRLDMERTT